MHGCARSPSATAPPAPGAGPLGPGASAASVQGPVPDPSAALPKMLNFVPLTCLSLPAKMLRQRLLVVPLLSVARKFLKTLDHLQTKSLQISPFLGSVEISFFSIQLVFSKLSFPPPSSFRSFYSLEASEQYSPFTRLRTGTVSQSL